MTLRLKLKRKRDLQVIFIPDEVEKKKSPIKEVMLRLRENLYKPLKAVKDNTGVAISNQCYAYIYKGLLSDGLICLEDLR